MTTSTGDYEYGIRALAYTSVLYFGGSRENSNRKIRPILGYADPNTLQVNYALMIEPSTDNTLEFVIDLIR